MGFGVHRGSWLLSVPVVVPSPAVVRGLCSICIVQVQPGGKRVLDRCRLYSSHPATWARSYYTRSGIDLPCLAKSISWSWSRWSVWGFEPIVTARVASCGWRSAMVDVFPPLESHTSNNALPTTYNYVLGTWCENVVFLQEDCLNLELEIKIEYLVCWTST